MTENEKADRDLANLLRAWADRLTLEVKPYQPSWDSLKPLEDIILEMRGVYQAIDEGIRRLHTKPTKEAE